MRALFTVTLFLSSALLFLVEPMIAKMILPRFGGSPGVWNASMVFFQLMLLLGYGYAHLATRLLGPRRQSVLHLAVLVLGLLALPIALPAGYGATGAANPAPQVLLVLMIAVGLPFFVLSAGAPLLQRWFADTGDPHGADPYFLYSASNVGSLLALLAYPVLMEPSLAIPAQTRLWGWGYGLLVVAMGLCAVGLWRSHAKPAAAREPVSDAPAPTVRDRARWVALAFCPSSLLLGLTTYLTANIAPIPLLWVVPLALYLVTFIIAFARRSVLPPGSMGRIGALLAVPLALTIVLESSEPSIMIPLAIFHLATFFVVALMCHGELARSRPHASRLTEFFFWVSVGGVLGGAFNALVAPLLFNSYFEYPLVLALAFWFKPGKSRRTLDWAYPAGVAIATVAIVLLAKHFIPEPSNARTLLAIGFPLVLVFLASESGPRFALSLVAFFVVASVLQVAVEGRIIAAKRSFFGVHRVETKRTADGVIHTLTHGNTVHGKENLAHPGVPLTYYTASGPIGQVFEMMGDRFRDVALVGLGVGSLAAYGHPGQRFTFFEIDPDVVAIARDPKLFDFLARSEADLKIVLGDARLELARRPAHVYDLIVLDAFSSDSIPVHLLTREAVALYLEKLRPGGILAFHISNRYLDLEPVLANDAAALGLVGVVFADTADSGIPGKEPSVWAVMARGKADLGPLNRDARFQPMAPDPNLPVWTDDYSNLLRVFRSLRP